MATIYSVKAPGKILWIGGYSVLERPNISFVSAVDAYVTAKLSKSRENSISLNAPQLGMSCKGLIDANTGHIDADTPKELLLFKTAAEVASRYVAGLGAKVNGFGITTVSDKAFAYSVSEGKIAKSGLGSSAAVTVATVGSVLKAFKMSFSENDALHKLSQIAHSIATGKVGSGFDIAASSFGSILYTRYSAEIVKELPPDYSNDQLIGLVKRKWDYTIERFPLPDSFRMSFANFGGSMITTQAIGSISKFKENDPHTYSDLITEINEQNNAAVKALRGIKNGNNDAFAEFRAAFNRGRSLTKKLGVLGNVGIEPDDCTDLIAESERRGAFVAKLPGAGGRDAIAALSLDDISQVSLLDFWRVNSGLTLQNIKPVEKGAV